ncbi:MAG: hypothetical protein OEZ06_21865 [Myxococcales bacterium]|nr:hypothetical protein [Myxococcales bacterium]
MPIRIQGILLIVALGALGCGASEPEASATSGAESAPAAPAPAAEPEPEPEPEPEAEAEPEPPPTGPATVTVLATVKGESVAADVKLTGADGAETSSKAGQAITVESGVYDLQVTLTDPATLADLPSRKEQVTLAAGDQLEHKVDFPWSKVALNVRVNGKSNTKATVELIRSGQVVAKVKSSSEPIMLSPGRYQAKVRAGASVIEVPEVMLPGGATRTVPVDVSF